MSRNLLTRVLSTVAAGLLLCLGALGCGDDEPVDRFPPAAEPADSPEPTVAPAGTLLDVGAEPEGIVTDARTGLAAVLTRDPAALTLVDLDRREVTDVVELPGTGRHLGLGSNSRVLVPAESSDEFVAVDLVTGEASEPVGVGDFPHDAAEVGERIFVGDEFGDTITVIDDGRATTTLDTAEQPGGVEAAGDYVAVVAVAERVLTVYDATTLEVLGELPAGTGATHVSADGERAFVTDTEGDAVLEFRVGPEPKLISTTEVPGVPYGIALDAKRERLWITLTETNELVAFDLSGKRPREIERWPTIRQPNTVAVDPSDGSAVVASRSEGQLEFIEAPR